ncbi:MAG: glycosyltransferase [Candidatus Nanohaloarchaea archaeon]|nr:glycosyltransferase [Candidatus Nanohaloarchaea archaeon]
MAVYWNSWPVLTGITFFGLIWTYVNVYHFYPLIKSFWDIEIATEDRGLYANHELTLDEEDYPVIDVLLPAYKESSVIENAISSIRSSDYPQDRLNINVLVEPNDNDTREELNSISEEYSFREIVIPKGYPSDPNKPRALDYGFEMTEGDIVGVIDAEDIVEPKLFRKVASALVEDDYDYLQGILDMMNENDGWRNIMFRGEYGFWYRVLLPSFYRSGYAIPLGGTTNFFHREVLEEISERRIEEYGEVWDGKDKEWLENQGLKGYAPWDPLNVTEDFELGLFLWMEDYEMALINAVTMEESPITLPDWIGQRTRWQKGRLYTLLQYIDRPPESAMGKIHAFTQSALPNLAPINAAGILFMMVIANIIGYSPALLAQVILTAGLVFFVISHIYQGYGYWMATDRKGFNRYFRTLINFLSCMFYWWHLWIAELRAMKQLYLDDLDWEKTTHHGRNLKEITEEGTSM